MKKEKKLYIGIWDNKHRYNDYIGEIVHGYDEYDNDDGSKIFSDSSELRKLISNKLNDKGEEGEFKKQNKAIIYKLVPIEKIELSNIKITKIKISK